MANRSINVSTRRCASMANASSSNTAASRLISCDQSGIAVIGLASSSEELRHQHSENRKQKRRAEEFRRAKDPQLGGKRLDERQRQAADGQLGDQHRGRLEDRRQ